MDSNQLYQALNGTCDKALFGGGWKQFLIKDLKPGQFVVMCNAAFHKGEKTKQLIASAGCTIIFLPPYSPDLNPIKKFSGYMKRWIKSKIAGFNN